MGRPRLSDARKHLEGNRSREALPDDAAAPAAGDFVNFVPGKLEPYAAPASVAGYDPHRNAGEFEYDPHAAAAAVEFFPRRLRHTEGQFLGQRFELEPWQRAYVATLFGWKRKKDGTRRYRESLMALPRKNGKTTLAAGIALYCLAQDREAGAQVYSAAYSRDQASLIFAPAARMVRRDPELSRYLKPIDSTKRITFEKTGSYLRSIPAEAANSHGFNASAVLFDELHTQRTRELYDVLKTSQGARTQPLFASITTAGYDRHSICWEVWQHARKVRDGNVNDPHFLPCIYELPDGADWKDEAVWHACNPNLGVSISLDFLREECRRAQDSPAYENTFRNLYLNQWTEQACRWLSMDKWRACAGAVDPAELVNAPCWGGLDLSTTTDLSALVLAFRLNDGSIALLCRFWAPEEGARRRYQRDRAPYPTWGQQGLLTLTPGDVVDYDVIRRDINELAAVYNLQELTIDRWNASQLSSQLQGDGINVTQFGQGYASMSPAAKEFEKLVIQGGLRHGGHEILTWCAANVAIEQDAAGNIKPSKAKSTERIDGIVAAVMAIGRAAACQPTSWFYEQHQVEAG